MRKIVTGLFAHRIEGMEPQIIRLEKPILFVGIGVATDTKKAYRDLSRLGKQYRAYKSENKIPNAQQPWGFAAVSKDFDEQTRSFTYLMGDVVTSLDEVPAGLTGFAIPAGDYAVFPVRPKNRFGWSMAIVNAKQYVYTDWLPRSGYEQARIIDEFEYHDERSTRKKNPEIDLYVAIRPKG